MTTGTREPSEEAVTAAMAEKSYDGGDGGVILAGHAPSFEQMRSLVRNKLRAAYAIDFPDAWGDS